MRWGFGPGALELGACEVGAFGPGALWGAVGFAALGVLAGAGARIVVGRLRRGVRVGPPWCELAVGLTWAVAGGAWAAGALAGEWLPVLLGLGWVGVALAAVDVVRRRLPDALTLPALPLVLVLLVPLGAGAVLRGAAGAAIAVGAHAAVRWWSPRALGGGDVKLAGSLGAVLAAGSWMALALAAVLAAVLTAGVALACLLGGRVARGDAVAHGPSMLLATWLVTLATAMAAIG
ncbi:MAG: prepilin peptidase [Pseudonocardia sp.]